MERAPRFAMKRYWIILVVIVLFTIAPLVSVLLTGSIAQANGCVVNEASVHPCIIWGMDWGTMLAAMGILGWLMLATLPIGFGLFVIWLLVLVVHNIAWRRRQNKDIAP